MESLNLTFLQSHLVWEDLSANLKSFSAKLNQLKNPTDVVVLPEMFTTGFSMNSKFLAEKMDGKGVTWMQMQSEKHQAVVLGSLIIEENSQFFNRLVVAFPNGAIKHYDKHHLFTLSGEHKAYTTGQERLQFNYKGWEICPLICYDLRFPIWARNTTNYDLLIYIASWPKTRIDAWDTLLKARAIENMSYVVGVNRVGVDGNQLEYTGHSAVYNCLGANLAVINENQEAMLSISLDKNQLVTTRNQLNFLNDRDKFKIDN